MCWSRSLVTRMGAGLFGLLFAVAASAATQPAPATAKSDAWQFDATPYLWFAGLNGDVGIGKLPTQGVEASFSDILNSLHIGLMGAFEGHKGPWGFVVDAIYIDLSDTVPTPNQVFGNADANLKQQLYLAAGTYRVLEGKVAVDVFAGVRYGYIGTDLTLTSGVASGRSASDSVDWWDGLVGTHVVYRPAKNWLVMGAADIGGGGSHLTWEALAGAGYEFNKLVALKFGYRYLSIDLEQDKFTYDVAMAGPYVGVGFRW